MIVSLELLFVVQIICHAFILSIKHIREHFKYEYE